MGKDLLFCFGCPFWQLVAFPPCPLESPDHSCQSPSALIIQYHSRPVIVVSSSSAGCFGLVQWHLLPLPPILPCREGMVGCLCWLSSAFSLPAHAPFPAPFLWLHFGSLISGHCPGCLQSLESPSAKGLSPAVISQADCISQPATETSLVSVRDLSSEIFFLC